MEEKNEVDKVDDVVLPGFRFHPTDEELVGFYLKRKILQQSLPIELIKQVDIYKYDPWDLPKLVATGEKEWYFYCPRDRKYRNSTRPNRVTGAGFWKATGTDRPIYSSDGAKCIGLKKSLVFYRGRAAKGIKTDWMMHEFRLPSLADSAPPKKFFDKALPANDSWAICRIFKKTNSMAQRALSHSWVSPLPESTALSNTFNQGSNSIAAHFSPENISCITEAGSTIQLCNSDFSTLDQCHPYKPITNQTVSKVPVIPTSLTDMSTNLIFPTIDNMVGTPRSTAEVSSMILNLSPDSYAGDVAKVTDTVDFVGSQQQLNVFPISLAQNVIAEEQLELRKSQNQQWNSMRSSIGFPLNLPYLISNSGTLSWVSAPCPSELSTSYSSSK